MKPLNRICCHPLSDDQLAEVNRIFKLSETSAQHNLRLALNAARREALSAVHRHPDRKVELLARAEALSDAVTLLAECWSAESGRQES